jgi:hypothetical protein
MREVRRGIFLRKTTTGWSLLLESFGVIDFLFLQKKSLCEPLSHPPKLCGEMNRPSAV